MVILYYLTVKRFASLKFSRGLGTKRSSAQNITKIAIARYMTQNTPKAEAYLSAFTVLGRDIGKMIPYVMTAPQNMWPCLVGPMNSGIDFASTNSAIMFGIAVSS